MYKNKLQFLHCVVLALMVCLPSSLLCQDNNVSLVLAEENAQREEIQRYFGYEDVLFRYLTLPYDISANVNQQGKYVDIGFALFALIPLTLLLLVYKNKKWFYGLTLFFTLYFFLCLNYSFVMNSDMSRYNPATDLITTSEDVDIFQFVLEEVYAIAGALTGPIVDGLGYITGPEDHVTYPIILALFIGIVWLVLRRQDVSDRFKVIFLITAIFSMLWWLLSGGIIWYGFVLLPLGYAFIFYGNRDRKERLSSASFKGLKVLSFSIIGFWVFTAYTSRISNISVLYSIEGPTKDTGKEIVDWKLMPYTVGTANAQQSLDNLAPNLSVAISKMNTDDALILQCGSSLQFDIENDQYRIFEDNNLSYFFGVANQHKSQSGITSYYRSVGIKYIILDLKLPTLDRTPERTLTRKFGAMLGLLKDNPSIRLVATDQQVYVKMPNGSLSPRMGVFADPNLTQAQAFHVIGSYAVFEIL